MSSENISPSSVYLCKNHCEGEKLYFQPGKCAKCTEQLIPIEDTEAYRAKPKTLSEFVLPESFKDKTGAYYCPMFCEKDKTYTEDTGCPVCKMHLVKITETQLEKAEFIHPDTAATQSYGTEEEKNAVLTQYGKYYCPMFCEGDKVYDSNVGCPVCGMDLVKIPLPDEESSQDELRPLKRKFFIALLCTVPLFILSMGGMWWTPSWSTSTQGILELLLSLPVLFYSGWFLMVRAWNSFRSRNLNMFSLIGLGVGVSFVFSLWMLAFPHSIPSQWQHGTHHYYFEAVCVIITLVILGQLMEAKAHQKTGEAIKHLMNLTPSVVHRLTETAEEDIPLSEVRKNDLLRVKPGEKIPVDGVITEGNTSIDESSITGEPIPATKSTGDTVTSGTINGSNSFVMRAEKVGSDTLLSQIIHMVGEAGRSKAPIQKLTDKVAKIFVPIVVLISVITFIAWMIFGGENRLSLALVNAVSVLIIACPCALGLATPMSLMVGIGKGAKNGVLVKNAEALEKMDKLDVLITDKTGTLTEGKPSLSHIETTSEYTETKILELAAAVSKNDSHPLSKAIINKWNESSSEKLPHTQDFETVAGKGIKAKSETFDILLGTETWLKAQHIEIPKILQSKLQVLKKTPSTLSLLAINGKAAAIVAFDDAIKKDAKEAVEYLKNKGIKIIMMTGDNESAARHTAEALHIDEYHANCLPADKMEKVRALQAEGKTVAMTGDGINDAPALALADVGIAMGTGTDIAIDSAEITLLKGDISGVVRAEKLSKKVVRNIKENLFFAFIYNSLGIPLAAGLLYPFFGIMLSPAFAAAAMSFSSLSVILNSLRLNNTKL